MKEVPDGWCQGHKQQAVEQVVLLGTQVLVGTARSHSWMQPLQKVVPRKDLADAEEALIFSLDLS